MRSSRISQQRCRLHRPACERHGSILCKGHIGIDKARQTPRLCRAVLPLYTNADLLLLFRCCNFVCIPTWSRLGTIIVSGLASASVWLYGRQLCEAGFTFFAQPFAAGLIGENSWWSRNSAWMELLTPGLCLIVPALMIVPGPHSSIALMICSKIT